MLGQTAAPSSPLDSQCGIVPAAARSDDAASSMMLEKGKCDKNGTKDIDIRARNVILQLGVGCQLMV